MSGTMAKESWDSYFECAALMAGMEEGERTVPRTLYPAVRRVFMIWPATKPFAPGDC